MIMLCLPRRRRSSILSAQNKKAHSCEWAEIPLNSLCLGDGPSLPANPERKSPPVRVGREFHDCQFIEAGEKRNIQFLIVGIS
jgi:hypothetical protein